jgi:hypothetical protein
MLIGGLVSLYIVQTERFNLGALTGAVSTLAGAGVIAVFHTIGNPKSYDITYWWYPVGLLFGAVVIALLKGKI